MYKFNAFTMYSLIYSIHDLILIKKAISWLVISIAMTNFMSFYKNWKNSVAKPCNHSNSLPHVLHKILVKLSHQFWLFYLNFTIVENFF